MEFGSDVDSAWSSDDSRPASPTEMAAAVFSPVHVQRDDPRNDMRMRKEAEGPSVRSSAHHALLAPYAAGTAQYADPNDLGTVPGDHDRETVGYLFDEGGKPYAAIRESLPPPPNINRHGQSHRHRLCRALGYDPHEPPPRKTEVRGFMAPGGGRAMHGDAEIAPARLHATAARARRGDTYHNQAHVQQFADVDAGRDAYDGVNVSPATRRTQAKRTVVEHSWRHHLAREHEPVRAHAHAEAVPARGVRTTGRTEVAQPFHLGSAPDVLLDAHATIPLVTHSSKREGNAQAGAAHTDAGGRVAAAAGRPTRADELAPPIDRVHDGHVVGASEVLRASGDVTAGEREHAGAARPVDHDVVGHAVGPRGGEREGADDHQVERERVTNSLSALGGIADANRDRLVPDDVAHASVRAHASVAFPAHSAERGVGDALDPHRASTEGAAEGPRIAGGGGVFADASVAIGSDRPPVDPSATWYFSSGGGMQRGDAARTMPHTTAKSGTHLGPDRLAQPHAADWRKQEARVVAKVRPGGAPVVAVGHLRGGQPPLQQYASGGAHLARSGRSTPLHGMPKPSPVALR